MAGEMAGDVRISAQRVWEEMQGMKEAQSTTNSLLEKHIALQEQTNTGVESRLENHGTRLANHDTELTSHSTRLSKLEDAELAREKKRAPWWQILASVGLGITLTLLIFDRIAPVFAR